MMLWVILLVTAYFLYRILRKPVTGVPNEFPRKYTSSNVQNEEYDYIVVGAGSAGCNLAATLVKGGKKVLLLEEGFEAQKFEDYSTKISRFLSALMSPVDLAYFTTSQKSSGGRSIPCNRGSTLGGCSTINALMFVRGNSVDYDNWETEYGAKGWSFKDVLPTFKKCETVKDGNKEFRGTEGPIHPRKTGKDMPFYKSAVDAMNNTGVFKKSDDYNSLEQEGAFFSEECVLENGKRADAFSAFVEPLLLNEKTNKLIRVVTRCKVKKIVFENKKAVGVDVDVDSQNFVLKPRKEIILCAGSIDSPHILMLSGVGPKEELEKFNIPMVHQNEFVGKNLHEHPSAYLPFIIKEEFYSHPKEETIGFLAQSFYKSSILKKESPNHGPDMQMLFASSNTYLFNSIFSGQKADEYMSKLFKGPYQKGTLLGNLKTNLFSFLKVFLPYVPSYKKLFKTFCFLILINNQPKSRGQLTLKSNNIDDAPIIDINMFEQNDDVEKLVESVEIANKILDTSPLKDMIETIPVKLTEKEKIVDFLRNGTVVMAHPVGTCKMGSGDDCVVDPKGRVIGVEGLRVADASNMPKITSGNTNWPCMMIGGRVGELILSDDNN